MLDGLPLLGPGYQLDRYEILRPVAQGGMGSVWLGRLRGKHGFEKLVAIKTILPSLANQERFRAMFLDEARLASRIEHANVAQVLDLGEDGELLYIVMEWVEGYALDAVATRLADRRIPLPLRIGLRILADACSGLHAAHELRDEGGSPLGVVHRDISPQNILVSDKGIAKVIDFGIARAREGLVLDANARTVKGKLGYIAPEQAQARLVDRRADVWALGAVLYELLTGATPVRGLDELGEVIAGNRTLKAVPESVPSVVSSIVARSLSVASRMRFESTLEMQRCIEHALVALGMPTTTADVAGFLADTLPQRLSRGEPARSWRTVHDGSPPRGATQRESRGRVVVGSAGNDDPDILSARPTDVAVARTTSEPEPLTAPRRPRARVLVVVSDVDPSPMLEPEYEVTKIGDGENAAGRARREGFDVLIASDLAVLDEAARHTPVLATVLSAEHADADAVAEAFNRGALHGLLAWPTSSADACRRVRCALMRVAADRSADESARQRQVDRHRLVEEEDAVRRALDLGSGELDRLRIQDAHAQNEARIRLIGETEARRATALGRPLSILVYRMKRPRVVIPASEIARVHSALGSGAAAVTEQYGEIVGLVPEESAPRVIARLDARGFAVGDAAVCELASGEGFATLLARTRASVGGR